MLVLNGLYVPGIYLLCSFFFVLVVVLISLRVRLYVLSMLAHVCCSHCFIAFLLVGLRPELLFEEADDNSFGRIGLNIRHSPINQRIQASFL